MKLSNYRDSLQIKAGKWSIIDRSVNCEQINLDNQTFGAVYYPLPEIAFAYWNYSPKEVKTFLLLPWDEAKFLQPISYPNDGIEEMLERLKKLKKTGPSEEERANQKCQINITVGDLNWKVETSDMYQLTAKCILILVQKIENNTTLSGVLNPALLCEGEELSILNSLGITIAKDNLGPY